MSSQVHLRLLPAARCLFDDPIQVRVSGLSSHQEVRLKARATDERGTGFNSWAVFRADRSGQIDLSRDAPLRGTYSGVHPMGLFWSMRPEIVHKFFVKTKVISPHVVKFSVHDEEEDRLLAEETNERWLMGNGVQRQTVEEEGFSGVLFTPPGVGPYPAVLDLCTSACEKRACLLANKGFVVLTLAVFTDRPDNYTELHLDQYEEAVQYLLSQPKVGSKDVGVMARSKGGDLALSLAAFVKGIGAVVWINGCSANAAYPLYYKKHLLLPALKADPTKYMPIISDTYIAKPSVPDPQAEGNQDTVVPIEKARAQFLFAASEEDLNWDAKLFMEQMVERLKHHGKDNFEAVSYPMAGHLLEPPFCPLIISGFRFIGQVLMLFGGEPMAHGAAEVHLWKKIQEFFRTHLKCDTSKANAIL